MLYVFRIAFPASLLRHICPNSRLNTRLSMFLSSLSPGLSSKSVHSSWSSSPSMTICSLISLGLFLRIFSQTAPEVAVLAVRLRLVIAARSCPQFPGRHSGDGRDARRGAAAQGLEELHPPGHRPQAGVGAGQWCSGGVSAQPPQLLHQVLQKLVNWWAGLLFQSMAPYMSGTWVGVAKPDLWQTSRLRPRKLVTSISVEDRRVQCCCPANCHCTGWREPTVVFMVHLFKDIMQ